MRTRTLRARTARRLGSVDAPIIDGEKWIAERLRFLREHLTGDLSEDERRAAEAEIETLSKERPIGSGGPRRLRSRRRRRKP